MAAGASSLTGPRANRRASQGSGTQGGGRLSSNPKAAVQERLAWSKACAEFIRRVGIPVTEVSDTGDAFLPHVRITAGALVADLHQCHPGDLLHEAGHLATIPEAFRARARGDLEEVQQAMHAWLELHGDGLLTHPEDPLARAVLQAGEAEATAWQYAAAQAVGLPDAWLFPPGSYGEESRAVLLGLKHNAYVGINGLQAAGWTLVQKNPHRSLPVYPSLAFWLCPAQPASA